MYLVLELKRNRQAHNFFFLVDDCERGHCCCIHGCTIHLPREVRTAATPHSQQDKVPAESSKVVESRLATNGEETPQADCKDSKMDLDEDERKFYISFIADSGASEHITHHENVLTEVVPSSSHTLMSANKNVSSNLEISLEGQLNVRSVVRNQPGIFLNLKVLFSKDVSENLLSLRRFTDLGYKILLDKDSIKIYDFSMTSVLIEGYYESPNWIVEFELMEANASALTVLSQTPKNTNTPTSLLKRSYDLAFEAEKDSTSDGILEIDDCNSDLPIIPRPTKLNSSHVECTPGFRWHVKLGHPSLSYLQKLARIMPELKGVVFDQSILDCEACIVSKMTRPSFGLTFPVATRQMFRIHSDVMGPLKPQTFPTQYRYIVVFIDDYSRMLFSYPMRARIELPDLFEQFLRNAHNLLGEEAKVCWIRCDGAKEYVEGKMNSLCAQLRIDYEKSPPHTPELNGKSERLNRTLQEKVRTMMFDSGLPLKYWDLALAAATYVLNRTCHKGINYELPIRKFNPKIQVNINKIIRFGSVAYPLDHYKKRKFDPNVVVHPQSKDAKRFFMVGYVFGGYKLLDSVTGGTVETHDVRFNEKLTYKDLKNMLPNSRLTSIDDLDIELDTWFLTSDKDASTIDNKETGEKIPLPTVLEPKHDTAESTTIKLDSTEKQNQNLVAGEQNNTVADSGIGAEKVQPVEAKQFPNPEIELGKTIETASLKSESGKELHAQLLAISERSKNICTEIADDDSFRHLLLADANCDPISYEAAISSEDSKLWKKAIDDELDSMAKNKVWNLLPRSTFEQLRDEQGRRPKIITSKWVFKRKTEIDGNIRYKSRLVIRGFQDRHKYGISEVYAPVTRLPNVRTILSLVNKHDLFLNQYDVKTAFLYGELNTPIYMEVPKGLMPEKRRSEFVCELKRSLYGLRVSPKQWNVKFTETMQKIGMKNSSVEPCIFTKRDGNNIVFLVLYVDDILIASNKESMISEVAERLREYFEITDLGEPKRFLGIAITRDRSKKIMKLDQSEYTQKILKRFGMLDCNTNRTPMVTKSQQKREISEMGEKGLRENLTSLTKFPFRELVGSLRYLTDGTRPDISYAVHELSKVMQEPSEYDWLRAKRVLRYLKGSINLGLMYRSLGDKFEIFADASFKDCQDGKSTSGTLILLFGDLVYWASKKQHRVAGSTCEAEYMAANEAVKAMLNLNGTIQESIGDCLFPADLFCDNESAIKCTEVQGNPKLKHIICHEEHIVREYVQRKEIMVKYVSSEAQLADILTKPQPSELFQINRDALLDHID